MRILFEMYHPGFLRNFEGPIRRLAERGHELVLAFERPARLGEERLVESLSATYPNVTALALKKAKRNPWSRVSENVRTTGDYLRYLDPRYAGATALRDRAAKKAPALVRRLSEARLFGPLMRSRSVLRSLTTLLRNAEWALPPSPQMERLLRDVKPDLILVTPLIGIGSAQADVVKLARKHGIPCALGVASWDNLTNKGVIRAVPERLLVWNAAQKQEAIELHGISGDRVSVCGAWTYDHWFSWKPECTRDEFMSLVGLVPERDYILYVCSSPFIAPHEVGFVRRWIAALRTSPHSALREIGVLVRPHPQNAEQWQADDLADLSGAVVWPRAGSNPIDAESRNRYFRSLYFSRGIVGINTSALVEAGIIGRPVFTITDPQFALTQLGTLHFHHLTSVNGGLLHTAATLDEHADQIAAALTDPSDMSEKSRSFVEAFIRPDGMEASGAARFVAVVESMAGQKPAPRPLIGPTLLRPPLALWRWQLLAAGALTGKQPAAASSIGEGGKA